MALTNKQKSFIKTNLTDDILETCSGGNSDNVVKFTVVSKMKSRKEQTKDQNELREIELKRETLWEIVCESMKEVPVFDNNENPTGEYKIDTTAAIEAIAELNKMDGHYAPEKFEYTVKFEDAFA